MDFLLLQAATIVSILGFVLLAPGLLWSRWQGLWFLSLCCFSTAITLICAYYVFTLYR